MYSDKLQKERNEAQETSVANKIMDLLEKLKLDNDENSSLRWVWELIQNAKDVVNKTGKVNINISFDQDEKIIKFEHDGKLFTTKNLVYLIEQVSTKERMKLGKEGRRETGKFGTGFLTTHLLSERVSVSGILKDEGERARSFEIELDRSGKDKESIIAAIKKSYNQLDCSQEMDESVVIDERDFNTKFIYKLEEEGIEVAEKGIENLYVALPYIFSFVPEIESVVIEKENKEFKRGEILDFQHKNILIQEVRCKENNSETSRYICSLKKENVAIAVEVGLEDEKIFVKEYSSKVPKIFCDFPLVGTENFSFPVIINSAHFNPTEPRDGIYITDKKSPKVDENKELIIRAYSLYTELLDYAAKKGWKKLFNIVKIKGQPERVWISKAWLEKEIIDKLKGHIVCAAIIDNTVNERKALYDRLGNTETWIVSDIDESIRECVWKLARDIWPKMLTKQDEIHNWYNSLWSKCHNFTLKNLVEEVEKIGCMDKLIEYLGKDAIALEWLNELYELILRDNKIKDLVLNGEIKIFPNQNGVFCSVNTLYIDENIDEAYKDILLVGGVDCRNKLLDKKLLIKNVIDFKTYNYESIFSEIQLQIEELNEKSIDVYKQLVVLNDSSRKDDRGQAELLKFINIIFPNMLTSLVQVNKISEELEKDVIKYWCNKIADKISSYSTVENLMNYIELGEMDCVIRWLGEYIEYIVRQGYEGLLNRKTKPILPNQNAIFKTKDELFLDSGDIDELLKDLSTRAGVDIREELLMTDIFLELPENRTKFIIDIASDIITYVKKHQGMIKNEDEQVKEDFKKFYIWLMENEVKANEYFSEVFKNKHWLYNDYEIAQNMKKAEEYDNLLERFNISDVKILEQILKKDLDKKSITEDIEQNKMLEELLVQSGIYTKEDLEKAISSNVFGDNFVHDSDKDIEKFIFANKILDRAIDNVIKYLENKPEYDLEDMIEIDKTSFIIKKHDEEMYLIIRPSDYKQVILHYETEKDILDYEKDWELWVEDGINDPEKISFGKMLRLTGINKIPLRRIR